MEKTRKVILGLKRGRDFSQSERHQMVHDYLTSGKKKIEIWQQYTGQQEEHGQLLKWLRQFGYTDSVTTRSTNFVAKQIVMSKRKKIEKSNDLTVKSFEQLQLEKRILELEKQLKDAELKAIAFSTMVDIAEKEFKIPIRKKLNTKPSQR